MDIVGVFSVPLPTWRRITRSCFLPCFLYWAHRMEAFGRLQTALERHAWAQTGRASSHFRTT